MALRDEFYVGYLASASPQIRRFLRAVVIALCTLAIAVGIVLVTNQRPFSPSVFEYGVNTTLHGYVHLYPVPHVNIRAGNAVDGTPVFQSVLLVGFGKASADTYFVRPTEGGYAHIRGYLIYGDGKALLQVNDPSDIQFDASIAPAERSIVAEIKQPITVSGEVIDPKCFFGVMKPGEGKPHRSCAIRCLAGGIPPVLKSGHDYYLLVSKDRKPLGPEMGDLVGDPVAITGEWGMLGDWKMLVVKRSVLSAVIKGKRDLQDTFAFDDGITMCR